MLKPSVLVLLAHPSFEHSRVNKAMAAAITGLEGITLHDLYEAYPDFHIDVAHEQALVEAHDTIVFHHPFYWYSSPALLKEWQDQVLLRGWAFGEGATKLQGKKLLSAVSTGAHAEAYQRDGMNFYAMNELLTPFDQTARLCGMTYLEPLVFHSANHADNSTITTHAEAYRAQLISLSKGEA